MEHLPNITMHEFSIEDFIDYILNPQRMISSQERLIDIVDELYHFIQYLNEDEERKDTFWYAYQEGLECLDQIKQLYIQYTQNPLS